MNTKYLASINSYFIMLLAAFLACTGVQATDKDNQNDTTKKQTVSLTDAITYDDINKIKIALAEGQTPSQGESNQILKLIIKPSCQKKCKNNEHVDVLELLIKQYPSLLKTENLLTKSCQTNNYDFVKKLLELSNSFPSESLKNCAFYCASEDYNASLQALFESNLLSFPLKNDDNQSILAVASSKNSINVVKFLLKSGKKIEVNYQPQQPEGEKKMTTALIEACKKEKDKNYKNYENDENRLAIVELLLKNNADPNLLDAKNQGPFSLAISNYPASGIPEAILKNKKFKWDIKYSHNNTILHEVVHGLAKNQEGWNNFYNYTNYKAFEKHDRGMKSAIYDEMDRARHNINVLKELLKSILDKNIIDPEAINEKGEKAIDLIKEDLEIKKQLEEASERYKEKVDSRQNQITKQTKSENNNSVIEKPVIENNNPKNNSAIEKSISKNNKPIQIIEQNKPDNNSVTEKSNIYDFIAKNDINGIKNALTNGSEVHSFQLGNILEYIINCEVRKKYKNNEHVSILKLILEKHLETFNQESENALKKIYQSNSYNLMNTLLQYKKDYPEKQIKKAAFSCVQCDYSESLRALLQYPSLTFPLRNDENQSILTYAAMLSDKKVVEVIVESKIDIEINYQHEKPKGITDVKGTQTTALIEACNYVYRHNEAINSLAKVKLLLAKNANPNLLDAHHTGAITNAITFSPSSGAARAILANDQFDYKVKYQNNDTILHYLIRKLDSLKNAKKRYTGDPDNINCDIKELEELLKIVLKKNIVDLEAVNKDGKKAIELTKYESIKKLLREAPEEGKSSFSIFNSKSRKIAGVMVLIILSLGIIGGVGFLIMKKKSKNNVEAKESLPWLQ